MSDQKPCRGCNLMLDLVHFRPGRGLFGRVSRCTKCETERRSRDRHGMTHEQKQGVVDQQGGCAICHRAEPGAKGWVVDHDHRCCSGETSCAACRRGVLCQWCNSMLGYAFDNPDTLASAIEYLSAAESVAESALPIRVRNRGRNGRTDGLTNGVVTSDGDVPVRNARETQTDFIRCCCIAQRIYCPRNCFLRWF